MQIFENWANLEEKLKSVGDRSVGVPPLFTDGNSRGNVGEVTAWVSALVKDLPE